MNTIGIIGNGFVGSAAAAFFRSKYVVKIYDIDPARSDSTIEEILGSDTIIVCVPTPTKENGSQDTGAVDAAIAAVAKTKATVFVKATVLPGTTDRLARDTGLGDRLYFWPEFLTARTAVSDFAKPTDVIIGTQSGYTDSVTSWVASLYPKTGVMVTTRKEAELIKYARNTYYATKVAWCNELYAICQHQGIEYNTIVKGMVASGWVAPHHLAVPGPDGMRGFGGACFPKDTQALATWAAAGGTPLTILQTAIESNMRVRNG